MTAYDTMVVGAGPAGSTTARLLAQRGARVLLLDRARFPRDKPCGGAVSSAAADELGLDLSPVIERTVTEAQISFRLGPPFRRTWPEPLAHMTQRCRLDAFIAGQAADAGADFRDGMAAREIDVSDGEVVVRAGSDVYRARALVGADGANGIVARALGLSPSGESAVALEGNVPASDGLPERWEHSVAVDLGGTPGGYGWLFPKGDHLNVGVGGWRWIGPTLRQRLAALCRYFGLDETRLSALRGYQLPMRSRGAPLARGPALLVGDAAGLVDPLSGEGIHAAFQSGRFAAEAIARYLSGEAADLSQYEAAIERELAPNLEVSRKLQLVFNRVPRPYLFALRRSDRFWGAVCGFIRGADTYAKLRRFPLGWALTAAAGLSGRGVDGRSGEGDRPAPY